MDGVAKMTTLASCLGRPYYADMTTGMEEAARRALAMAPGSLRALADRAGLSEKLLRLIRDGERTATERTVTALAEALDEFADEHTQAATILRDALQRREDHD